MKYLIYCVQRTNIQNLKAIHNISFSLGWSQPIVFKERIYKIWKQFTTILLTLLPIGQLCSKNEYTKSESNSQHVFFAYKKVSNCVQRTNIQNLKAIHNIPLALVNKEQLCSKNEYTKSESNSQPLSPFALKLIDCVQRTNIQNLKAIHNGASLSFDVADIVFKERIYKIWKQFTTRLGSGVRFPALCSKNEYTKSESNSQPVCFAMVRVSHCVQRTNIQNLKAIHNRFASRWSESLIVFKERIYKIWKQFTTTLLMPSPIGLLCSKNEYTKSESNSQRIHKWSFFLRNCVQRTNIQNLKAIHNLQYLCTVNKKIVFKERIYKIWKQFTTIRERMMDRANCVQRTNIQNLKAIHNKLSALPLLAYIVFKERIYKIWKQFTTLSQFHLTFHNCVQRTNIQNLKAIHNILGGQEVSKFIVFKERIYKIWKQFTTSNWKWFD